MLLPMPDHTYPVLNVLLTVEELNALLHGIFPIATNPLNSENHGFVRAEKCLTRGTPCGTA